MTARLVSWFLSVATASTSIATDCYNMLFCTYLARSHKKLPIRQSTIKNWWNAGDRISPASIPARSNIKNNEVIDCNKIMDKFHKISLLALSITIIILSACIWLAATSDTRMLDKLGFESHPCSCSSNCSYSHSCHRLLGTNWKRAYVTWLKDTSKTMYEHHCYRIPINVYLFSLNKDTNGV